MPTLLEPWSRDYLLASTARVYPYRGDHAIMDPVMFEELYCALGEVVGFVDGLHYEFKTEQTIPAGAAAVPRSDHKGADGPFALLLCR